MTVMSYNEIIVLVKRRILSRNNPGSIGSFITRTNTQGRESSVPVDKRTSFL